MSFDNAYCVGRVVMKVRIEKVIKHLKTQIAVADSIDSDFVYITKNEAKKCLELAEAEDIILMEPVKAEIEGGGSSWWNVCGECHSALNPSDKFCHECGRKITWE